VFSWVTVLVQRIFMCGCCSVTELAREQPLDSSLTNSRSNDASTVVSAASSGVLPSPDVLNSLDMIHSWLQQSEKQAVVVTESRSNTFTHTSNLVTADLAQCKQLPLSATYVRDIACYSYITVIGIITVVV